MIAAEKGNVGIVRKLIHHGASVNLTNKVNPASFQTLHLAAWHNTDQVNACLLS